MLNVADEVTLILTLSLLLWLSPFIANYLKVATAPVEIILGSIAGFLGFLHEQETFKLMAEVGFLYLMFLAGLEVNIKQLFEDKVVKKLSLYYLVILYALSFLIGYLCGFSLMVITIIPLISVGMITALSKEYADEKWLALALKVGIFGEVVSIAILTFIDAVSEYGFGVALFEKLTLLVAFLVGMFILYRLLHWMFWWYPELKNHLMPKIDNKEQDIRLAIATFFILVALMLSLHLELAFGSFLAGSLIASFFYHKKQLEDKLSSFGFGFLVPLFFIYIGFSFDLGALGMPGLVSEAVLITFVMIIVRVAAIFVIHKKDALLLGLSHSMPLTLLIAVATIGYNANSIDKFHYYALILASLLQIVIATTAIKYLIYRKKKQQKTASSESL